MKYIPWVHINSSPKNFSIVLTNHLGNSNGPKASLSILGRISLVMLLSALSQPRHIFIHGQVSTSGEERISAEYPHKKENRMSSDCQDHSKKCEIHGTLPQPTPMLSLIPFIPILLSLILFSTRLLQGLFQLNRSFYSLIPFQRTPLLLANWINLLSSIFMSFSSCSKELYFIHKIYLNSTPLWFFFYLCMSFFYRGFLRTHTSIFEYP